MPTTDIETQTQRTFRALADPTRRAILRRLSKQDMTIGELDKKFDMTRAAVKKHLTMLEEGGLIHVRSNGRERINSLQPDGLKTASNWLSYFDQFWDEKLLALKEAIEGENSTTTKKREK